MKLHVRTTYMLDGELLKETVEVEDYKEAMVVANSFDRDWIVVVSVDIYHA